MQSRTNEYVPRASDYVPTKLTKPSGAATANIARLREEREKANEDCEHWKNRYSRTKRRCEEAERSCEQYVGRCEQYKDSINHLRVQLEDEKTLAAAQRDSYELALEQQKAKFDKLHSQHIRSVNLVGTGLEPITDQEFKGTIRELQDQVHPPPPPPRAMCVVRVRVVLNAAPCAI